jgi:hypothetical protein
MLIVENGTGLPNADSYVSLAEADEYHEKRGNQVWATLSEARREQLLRLASDYITYIFGNIFVGKKAVAGQSLVWPRISTVDINLYTLGVPRQIREATAELALVANTTALMPNNTNGPAKRKVKVGPIEVEYVASAFTGPRFLAATARLAEFVSQMVSSGIQAKVIRT